MYLAMDMGTSNTRVWLCNKSNVIDSKRECFGAKSGKLDGKPILFERVKRLILEILHANHLSESDVECIITSGMCGSEIGLCEVPHVELPQNIYTEAQKLCVRVIPEITEIPFWFVPGLKKVLDGSVADLMRGEETELFGLLPHFLHKASPAVIVLPGTHNKMIRVNEHGEITDFKTTFSGEMLDMIVTKSILAGSVSHEFEISEADVLQGAAYAEVHGINAAVFHVRVMEKNGTPKDALSSFLYGAIIGEDAKIIRRYAGNDPVFIGGNPRLQAVHRILLKNISAVPLNPEVTGRAVVSGLQRIHSLYRARMQSDRIRQAIEKEKLIAIIRNPERDTLIEAVRALYDGGVRLVEVTFDRSGKLSRAEVCGMISELTEAFGEDMMIGAGTVTSCDEVRLACEAGASFMISPNCDPEIIKLSKKLGTISIPAAYTPTEIAMALNSGADYIKLFPADGVTAEYVKAIRAPLSDAKLLAVGGVTDKNAKDFLRMGFSGVGVGSNLYDQKLIRARDFESLKELASKYVEAIKK